MHEWEPGDLTELAFFWWSGAGKTPGIGLVLNVGDDFLSGKIILEPIPPAKGYALGEKFRWGQCLCRRIDPYELAERFAEAREIKMKDFIKEQVI